MAASVVVSLPAPRRRRVDSSPSALIRRGLLGAESCAMTLLAHGVSPVSGRTFPTVLTVHSAVAGELRQALRVAVGHPTLATLRDAFAAVDAVLVAGKRATRSQVEARALSLAQWSVAMAGLRAALDDINAGLEAIVLLPYSASDYPEEE